FRVALVDDALHLGVDPAGRLLAEGLLADEGVGPSEIGVALRRELHEPEFLAHPPAGDHVARELRRLRDVVLRARRLRPVDYLLRAPPGRPLAAGLLADEGVGPSEIGVALRRELPEPEFLAHPPAGDHVARALRRLRHVVLRARRLRPVDDILRRPPPEHADD